MARGQRAVAGERIVQGYKWRLRRDMEMGVSGMEIKKTGDFNEGKKKGEKRGEREE